MTNSWGSAIYAHLVQNKVAQAVLLIVIGCVFAGGFVVLHATAAVPPPPSSPLLAAAQVLSCSSCNIPMDPNTGISPTAKANMCAQYPSGDACTRWDDVINFAKSVNFNPALLLAEWGQESAFGTTGFALGITSCAADLNSQMNCFQQIRNNCSGVCSTAGTEFCSWAECWSAGSGCTVTNNPNFLGNLYDFYKKIAAIPPPASCTAPGGPPPPPGGGLGEECGGGTTQITGLGPSIDNISSCDACKQIASCVGSKAGVSDPGYLWDSVSKICGVGVVADQNAVNSCAPSNACMGVDTTAFQKVKSDILNAYNQATAVFGNGSAALPETLGAVLQVESQLNPIAGTGIYPTDFTPSEQIPFATICSQAGIDAALQAKFGKTCLQMPVSQDPDGAGPVSGGRMGIGQIYPSVFLNNIFLIATMGGGATPIPWDQYTGVAATEGILSTNLGNFDFGACLNTCQAGGDSISACQVQCTLQKEECAVIDYHYGNGSCATKTPEQTAYADKVRQLKPTIKSLLLTGQCPGSTSSCNNITSSSASIDVSRLNQILPDNRALVDVANKLFTPSTPLRSAFSLAEMHAESSWQPVIGNDPAITLAECPAISGHSCFGDGTPAWAICADKNAYFNGPSICGNPQTAAEVQFMYGQSCNTMNVTCDGGVGMASFQASTWEGNFAQTLAVLQGLEPTRNFTNPFRERDAMAANASYLAQRLVDCGSEQGAFFAYVSGSCSNPPQWVIDRWDQVMKPLIDELQALIDQGCSTQAKVPGCPLNPPVTLVSDFCPIDPTQCQCYIAGLTHRGVDLQAATDTNLYAVEDGTVNSVGSDSSRGNFVLIDNNAGTFQYAYYHMDTAAVNIGDIVKAGQFIGLSDNTGVFTTGPHLHFGVWDLKAGAWVDPRNIVSCIPQNCGQTK